MNDAEAMAAERDRRIALGLAGFLVWQAGDIALQLCRHLGAPQILVGAAVCTTLIGAIAFVAGALRIWRLHRFLRRNRPLAAIPNDEGVHEPRLRALVVGFSATMAVLALTVAIAAFVPLPARICGQIAIAVGVGASQATWLYLRRRAARGCSPPRNALR